MITGYKLGKSESYPKVDNDYVNSLNDFYCRFENSDNADPGLVTPSCSSELPVVNEHEVRMEFKRVHARKACGPNGVKSKILKMCHNE